MMSDSLLASSLVSATSTQSPVMTLLLPKLMDTLPSPPLFMFFSGNCSLLLEVLCSYGPDHHTPLLCGGRVHSLVWSFSLPDLMS